MEILEKNFELSDIELKLKFENLTLYPELFTHEAHLRLAWVFITKYGFDNAMTKIKIQLKSFATFIGAPEKYNEGLTDAAIRTVYEFIRCSETDNFNDFIQKNKILKNNFKEIIETRT